MDRVHGFTVDRPLNPKGYLIVAVRARSNGADMYGGGSWWLHSTAAVLGSPPGVGAFRTSPIEAELIQSNYEIMQTRWRCYRGEEIVLERRPAVAP